MYIIVFALLVYMVYLVSKQAGSRIKNLLVSFVLCMIITVPLIFAKHKNIDLRLIRDIVSYLLVLFYISFCMFLWRAHKKTVSFIHNTGRLFTCIALFAFFYIVIAVFPYYVYEEIRGLKINSIREMFLPALYRFFPAIARSLHFAFNAMTTGQLESLNPRTVVYELLDFYKDSENILLPLYLVTAAVILAAPFTTAAWLLNMISAQNILLMKARLQQYKLLFFCDIGEVNIAIAEKLESKINGRKIKYVFLDLTGNDASEDSIVSIEKIGGLILPDYYQIRKYCDNLTAVIYASDMEGTVPLTRMLISKGVKKSKLRIITNDYHADKNAISKYNILPDKQIRNMATESFYALKAEMHETDAIYIIGQGRVAATLIECLADSKPSQKLILMDSNEPDRESYALSLSTKGDFREVSYTQSYNYKLAIYLSTSTAEKSFIFLTSDDDTKNVQDKTYLCSNYMNTILEGKIQLWVYCEDNRIVEREKLNDSANLTAHSVHYYGGTQEMIDQIKQDEGLDAFVLEEG